jgi:AraC-like DNA-binding protein
MQTAIEQILNCPYHGITKQIYLESKALELITLQLYQLQNHDQPTIKTSPLKAEDIERIYHAKEILLDNIQNPPSLLELARQAAINDHKLKRGFRQVFGTTVFGYLHDHRIATARHLIESGDLGIGEIARQVGFSDRSYFASAFRKKFGLNPIQYMCQHRKKSV